MHKIVRRVALVSSALVAAAPLVSAPAQAQERAADPNPYSPRRVCGSSYFVVRDRGGIGGRADRPITYRGQVYGHVYLLYSARTRQNCVVAIKSRYVGRRTWMSATLAVRNGRSETDRGYFTYYAGPVKLAAAGRCVKYTAMMRLDNGRYAFGGRDTWGNCGA